MKIEIEEKTAEKLKQRVEQKDQFNSIEEYVNYILDRVVKKLEEKKEDKQTLSEEEQEKIKKRLRALGYMD